MPHSLEEAAAKGSATAKGAKANIKGLSCVFKMLMQERGEVCAPAERAGMRSAASARRELYPTTRKELRSREKSELEAAIKIHDELDFSGAEWAPAFERLFRLVQQYVAEEEGEFFPNAQDVIGGAPAQSLEGYESATEFALAGVS